jgi:hypothetical protein
VNPLVKSAVSVAAKKSATIQKHTAAIKPKTVPSKPAKTSGEEWEEF